ncbi:hypothetical protein [Microbulbifer sp. ZKSA002]|uniref:hypothetical protein n=1 Tax=Microbulbifer sp. ZKSA002 TaxID=3243388 RepID=UPI0040399A6A
MSVIFCDGWLAFEADFLLEQKMVLSVVSRIFLSIKIKEIGWKIVGDFKVGKEWLGNLLAN